MQKQNYNPFVAVDAKYILMAVLSVGGAFVIDNHKTDAANFTNVGIYGGVSKWMMAHATLLWSLVCAACFIAMLHPRAFLRSIKEKKRNKK